MALLKSCETFRGRAYQEGVGHWEQVLNGYIMSPNAFSLSPFSSSLWSESLLSAMPALLLGHASSLSIGQ